MHVRFETTVRRRFLPLVALAVAATLPVACGGDLTAYREAASDPTASETSGAVDAEAEVAAAGEPVATMTQPTTQPSRPAGEPAVRSAESLSDWPSVEARVVEYEHDGTTLEGYLAYDAAVAGPRPGVLIVHQWRGVTDYERRRARQLAALGYVAFAADIYGKGARPETTSEASETAGHFRGDRPLLRGRAAAGLARLAAFEQTDDSHLAAIGYCFGGTAVIELAMSGAPVDGVISFHGGFAWPTPDDFANISGQVLIAHGAEDPAADMDGLWATIGHLRDHGARWRVALYSQAVHSFTQREAGDDPSRGSAYDERADRLSWADMQTFFHELWHR